MTHIPPLRITQPQGESRGPSPEVSPPLSWSSVREEGPSQDSCGSGPCPNERVVTDIVETLLPPYTSRSPDRRVLDGSLGPVSVALVPHEVRVLFGSVRLVVGEISLFYSAGQSKGRIP